MKIITAIIIERNNCLSLEELSQATHARKEVIIEMIQKDLITPKGESPANWQFDDRCLKRTRRAMSFYHDLDINMEGVALALDLLDKIEDLENTLRLTDA